MTQTQTANVTRLLAAWREGDDGARAAAFDAVYAELRRLARGYLRRERASHSLPPTALVHEAYFRLIEQSRVRWRNRSHFFAIAAQAMRRILVDHARTRAAAKRGAACTVPLVDDVMACEGAEISAIDVLALDVALTRLAACDARQARLVELRFFGGLTVEETADALGVAVITVKRDWALAKAWLYRELRSDAPRPEIATASGVVRHEARMPWGVPSASQRVSDACGDAGTAAPDAARTWPLVAVDHSGRVPRREAV